MNQSLTPDLNAIMPAVKVTGLERSLCTIQVPPSELDQSGATDPNASYSDLSGVTNIPCLQAPIATNETKNMEDILAKGWTRVLLDGYYPTIQPWYRAVVDGAEYDLVGVEHDSQRRMTRLTLQRVQI